MRREKCVHCKYDRHIYRQNDIDTLISKEQLMVFIKDFLDSILDDPNTKCCPNCGSQNTQKRNLEKRLKYLIRRLQCQDCGKWFYGDKVKKV